MPELALTMQNSKIGGFKMNEQHSLGAEVQYQLETITPKKEISGTYIGVPVRLMPADLLTRLPAPSHPTTYWD